MILYHLWLLIKKSFLTAWRLRICHCCPKIVFELLVPLICILFLSLIRWTHTPPRITSEDSTSNSIDIETKNIILKPASIVPPHASTSIFNFTSSNICPYSTMSIGIVDNNLLNRLKKKCPRSKFTLTNTSFSFLQDLTINGTPSKLSINYDCTWKEAYWCQNKSKSDNTIHQSSIQHPSVTICNKEANDKIDYLLNVYLSIESFLYPPKEEYKLSIYSWPCSSYGSDPLFDIFPDGTLVIILVFIDGCILFSFNLLFHALIDEKHQGVTELLRLISVKPISNSLAWFCRIFFTQLIPNIILIGLLKASIDGGTYLPFVSIWLIIPTITLWTIQVLSRAVLVGHYFSSNLKATIWSWLIYFLSFWLAMSSSIRLPISVHMFASAWLPFYSIKRLFILLFRINTDLGRGSLLSEVLLLWLCMLCGTTIMWLFAYYLEQVRPGKYGIPRSWTWPCDYFRCDSVKGRRKDESIDMQTVETLPDSNTTVRINNLTKIYGGFNAEKQVAVDHISFKLEKSTICGLIGHNGAGKTSTMEMICGLIPCDHGTIEIHDKDLHENLDEIRTCIGYCPQQDILFSYLTVQEQLEFYASVRTKTNNVDHKQIIELLAMMDMTDYSQQLCHTLSGGMKRKVSILCAFVGHANVIILDEPSSSLDLIARRLLWAWLREHKTNRTLLISSHLLDEVEELCDSVIILDSGKICAQGSILELKKRFGPPGDRLHLNEIPRYVPREWIMEDRTNIVQVPHRKQLIQLLEELDKDKIMYTLENVTLDDVFAKLTSSMEGLSAEDSEMKTSIKTLFNARTNNERGRLWYQQICGVLIRRSQILLRRARLLPFVLFLYLAYALSPLYVPSFVPKLAPSAKQVRYIVSSPSDLVEQLPLKHFNTKILSPLHSAQEFEKYLLRINAWQSDGYFKTLIGLRISSHNHLECYVPSPILNNILDYCLPIYASFYNRTMNTLNFVSKHNLDSLSPVLITDVSSGDTPFYCTYMLPFRHHGSVILLSIILILPAALIIQDYSTNLHSYSLIHGLHSLVNWMVIFLTDLILCLLWLVIIILIARFVHSSKFDGQFFALIPLIFIVNLPFIYLIAKFFNSPILGGTVIVFILQFAHISNLSVMMMQLFRGQRLFSAITFGLRWVLLLLFPNVNVLTLMVTILQLNTCLPDYATSAHVFDIPFERYPHRILIHSLIFIGQFLLYFVLLVIIDKWRCPVFRISRRGAVQQQEEDSDVAKERHRIETTGDDEKRNEALVVENVSKYYGSSPHPAVNGLTFAVSRRQCFGLLGFNGSGKTTMFRMLVGELRPTSGKIYKNKSDLIGYCPQDDINFSALTVVQSIDYICRIHGLKPSSINDLILAQFQLEKYRHRLVSHLSGGTRRRLHLALCLIGSPTLLLLDEPTAKVDPLLRAHIRLLLQNRPSDTTIIFASHSMLECEQLCDRLTILVRGNAKCLGSPRHLKNKYGTDYRIKLTPLRPSLSIPELIPTDDANEYTYPRSSLSNLFRILEGLVERNMIASNYTVQLTSLEHVFLQFQYTLDTVV